MKTYVPSNPKRSSAPLTLPQNRRYWDTTISGAYIVPSRTSILETIPKVVASPPKISSKSSTGAVQRVFFGFTGLTSSHPWLSAIILIAGLVIGWMYGKGRVGRRRGISLGSGFLGMDEKDRVSGGVGNGKAD